MPQLRPLFSLKPWQYYYCGTTRMYPSGTLGEYWEERLSNNLANIPRQLVLSRLVEGDDDESFIPWDEQIRATADGHALPNRIHLSDWIRNVSKLALHGSEDHHDSFHLEVLARYLTYVPEVSSKRQQLPDSSWGLTLKDVAVQMQGGVNFPFYDWNYVFDHRGVEEDLAWEDLYHYDSFWFCELHPMDVCFANAPVLPIWLREQLQDWGGSMAILVSRKWDAGGEDLPDGARNVWLLSARLPRLVSVRGRGLGYVSLPKHSYGLSYRLTQKEYVRFAVSFLSRNTTSVSAMIREFIHHVLE